MLTKFIPLRYIYPFWTAYENLINGEDSVFTFGAISSPPTRYANYCLLSKCQSIITPRLKLRKEKTTLSR